MMKYIQPLKKVPRVTSNSIEECEAMISKRLSQVTILNNPARDRFQISMTTAEIGKSSFTYSFFSETTKLKLRVPDDDYHLVFSAGKQTKFQIGKKLVTVFDKKGVILDTNNLKYIERTGDSEVLDVRIPRAEVFRHFDELTGQYHKGSLRFENCIDLTSNSGAMLDRVVDYIIKEFNSNDLLFTNSAMNRSMNHILLSAILSLPHNKLEQLNENASIVVPAIVRRAEEYMNAHLNEPVTIIDLLRVCDCSRSVLFSSFRNFRNYTPMEFLTEQRLQHARRTLLHPKETDTVSSIAANSGFMNFGRFAQCYGNRFGERPSITLQTSKRNS